MYVTICVLIYGDFPQLVYRCLHSIWVRHPQDAQTYEIRVGLNQPSDRAYETVRHCLSGFRVPNGPKITLYDSTDLPPYKYPRMRQMFEDLSDGAVMWFDDDSCLRGDRAGAEFWWNNVREKMEEDADMLGSLYTVALTGNQHQWIEDQPWYGGKPVQAGQKVQFATGGWWCLRTDVIKKFNWPIPALEHRGGDVMLGELCRQQDLRLRQFREGVAINADDKFRESQSPRRGFDSRPIGWNYVRPAMPAARPAKRWLELDL